MKSTWEIKQPFGAFAKLLISLFIVVIIPAIALTFWVNWALAPVDKSTGEKVFVIKKGETSLSFSQRLQEERLIRSAFIFRVYLKFSGLDKEIQAGSFKLSGGSGVKDLAESLTKGRVDKWVTIIEGLRKEEIAEILSGEFEINKSAFLKRATEGKLFPDTYLIPVDANEGKIIEIFEKNFETKFDNSLQQKAKQNGLTPSEALVLASIVERESSAKDERPVIAGILLKRLREGIALGADATVQYALGYSTAEKAWWRKILTEEDLVISSQYNTRKNVGLPPTPICNPGLSSLQAVASPKETPYYFYLHDSDGNIHYAETFGEHQQNISKYLQ